jgi:hypothetical protein
MNQCCVNTKERVMRDFANESCNCHNEYLDNWRDHAKYCPVWKNGKIAFLHKELDYALFKLAQKGRSSE